MKILHVSRTMGQGGAEKIVYQLCVDNSVHEQYVISCGGQYVEELEQAGVKHFMISDMDKKNPFLMLECLIKIWYVVLKEHIDIIHSHHRMAAFYARIISIFTGKKCVYTAHNVFYNKKKLLKFALKNSKIVAVGDGVKRNLMEEYSIPEDRIQVIYNSIKIEKTGEEDLLLKELKKKGKYLIGTIGRISEQKGMDVFVKAIRLVIDKYPNVVGVIVGDGEDRKKIEGLVRELDLSKNIVFLGYQKNVLDIISQLEFVVLASRWEGLPLTPIEVFSQGKIIIASNISGNNEIVDNRLNGLLCEINDVREFSEKICLLLEDIVLLKKLENNAEQKYREVYSYSVFIEKYNYLYEQCINEI